MYSVLPELVLCTLYSINRNKTSFEKPVRIIRRCDAVILKRRRSVADTRRWEERRRFHVVRAIARAVVGGVDRTRSELTRASVDVARGLSERRRTDGRISGLRMRAEVLKQVFRSCERLSAVIGAGHPVANEWLRLVLRAFKHGHVSVGIVTRISSSRRALFALRVVALQAVCAVLVWRSRGRQSVRGNRARLRLEAVWAVRIAANRPVQVVNVRRRAWSVQLQRPRREIVHGERALRMIPVLCRRRAKTTAALTVHARRERRTHAMRLESFAGQHGRWIRRRRALERQKRRGVITRPRAVVVESGRSVRRLMTAF